MIHFKNISKEFPGNNLALNDVTLQIGDGEFVFLIGPSGAGKTTLLRLLLRDMLPSSGSVMVDEIEVNTLPVAKVHLLRRKIGMVFQDFKLLLDRTVYENVAISLEILGKRRSEIHKDVMDILGLVGLKEKAEMFPQQLSAGELQRTGIARAIVGGPQILLADEPTGNLDPVTSQEVLDIISEINKIGTTVIMATHNVAIVNDMKKRTVVINKGKITSDEQKGKYKMSSKQKGK